MSRETWRLIKESKRFYVNTFRMVGSALFISIFINFFLGLVIYYVYHSRPEPDFYATNGVTAPIELTSMDAPNDTSAPLLPDDPESDDDNNKVIPE